MKSDAHDEENDVTEEHGHNGKSEGYSDEMARNAAKSLFDDDEADTQSKESRYVSGYERPSRAERISREETEKPAEEEEQPRDRYSSRSDRLRADSSPSANPRGRTRLFDEGEEDQSEGGGEYSSRRRPRTDSEESETGEDPSSRAAVKVSPASAGRRPQSSRSRPVSSARDEEEDDGYNTFRNRGRKRERESREAREAREAREMREEPRYEPRTDGRPPLPQRPPSGGYYRPEGPPRPGGPQGRPQGERIGYGDLDPMNIIRYAAAFVALVILIIMVVLVFQNARLRRELNEANLKIETIPSVDSEVTVLQFTNEKLEEELQQARDEIISLEKQLTDARTGVYTPAATNGNENQGTRPTTDVSQTAEPTPAQQRTHTVVRGETLSKIAAAYYGTGSQANIQKIIDANPTVITNPNNIKPGDVYVIP